MDVRKHFHVEVAYYEDARHVLQPRKQDENFVMEFSAARVPPARIIIPKKLLDAYAKAWCMALVEELLDRLLKEPE